MTDTWFSLQFKAQGPVKISLESIMLYKINKWPTNIGMVSINIEEQRVRTALRYIPGVRKNLINF